MIQQAENKDTDQMRRLICAFVAHICPEGAILYSSAKTTRSFRYTETIETNAILCSPVRPSLSMPTSHKLYIFLCDYERLWNLTDCVGICRLLLTVRFSMVRFLKLLKLVIT